MDLSDVLHSIGSSFSFKPYIIGVVEYATHLSQDMGDGCCDHCRGASLARSVGNIDLYVRVSKGLSEEQMESSIAHVFCFESYRVSHLGSLFSVVSLFVIAGYRALVKTC